jgi:uncharacterized protein DUF4956
MDRIPKSPFVQLAGYYVLLGLAVVALIGFFPGVGQLFEEFQRLSPVHGVSSKKEAVEALAGGGGVASLGILKLGLITILSMLGALALSLPVARVFMVTKERQGYDQAMVQTVIVLPMTVAATLILVQNSIALAFAMGAIVAGVRFRSTLKDPEDVVYIFLALGIGLAAGVFAPVVAAAASVLFNFTLLTLWKFNVGNVYADRATLGLPAPLSGGDLQLRAALTPQELQEAAERSVRLRQYIEARAESKKGKKRFNHLLVVHVKAAGPAQHAIEGVLEQQTERWALADIESVPDGNSTLEYLVRLGDSVGPDTLLEAIRTGAAPHVITAEMQSLHGLRKPEH